MQSLMQGLATKDAVLLGGGQLGRMTLDMWPEILPPPVAVLDATRLGVYRGVPIQSLGSHSPDPETNVYVLCFFKELASRIIDLFENRLEQEIFISYDVLTGYRPTEFTNGWAPTKPQSSFQDLFKCFEDQRSRAVLQSVLDWRFNRYLSPDFDLSEEGRKYDVAKYGRLGVTYDYVLDFGSYDGSLLTQLRGCGNSYRTAHLFEPDEANRLFLESRAPASFSGDVHVYPEAVWERTGTSLFTGSALLSSRIITEPTPGCVHAHTLTLHDAIALTQIDISRPFLMKLHVEGAEFPVMQSSFESGLDLSTADILINLSHDEESLLLIPRLLHAQGDHDLFLETHSHFGEGLTLFARSKRW